MFTVEPGLPLQRVKVIGFEGWEHDNIKYWIKSKDNCEYLITPDQIYQDLGIGLVIDRYKQDIYDKDPVKTLCNLVSFVSTHTVMTDDMHFNRAARIAVEEIIDENHFDIQL